MKLLFDQNISHRMTSLLSDLYPGSSHVKDHGLQRADDEEIWKTAKKEGLVIVSKDADFHERSFLRGFPPKVIWLRAGNCSTAELAKLLRSHVKTISNFYDSKEAAFLIIP